ncbi:flagellar biosynthesis protein FlhF [Blastopirellula marina]|uniref:Flagellar biosynthesis protein FlhF n=1 Tax=Blastopirellula marina TaxID=124 RepID=A0A2S8F4A1_9BACT|nr:MULTISPECIES: flagellar biosynthesis protein FlhF [Pirellulaceae]PQO26764.1 flagellar biosynthesis protein FlhF [Blastopirellula marina]RCS46243.1 flagellar biosynthesis protein FlhF [Bremerella cremea]
MDIRSFRAKSMPEALELVRKELGPDAALLHTREVPQRGLKGLFGGKEIELAASSDSNLKSRFQVEEPEEESEEPEAVAPETIEQFNAPLLNDIPKDDTGIDLEAMSFSQSFFSTGPGWPPSLLRIRERLVEAEVPGFLADSICEKVLSNHALPSQQEEVVLLQAIRNELAESMHVGHDIENPHVYPRIVAAIGPTGVGKTTTIAKLAARAKFDHKRRVGLVTVDTYRIAAVDQLQTYAEIMDLPMKIVSTPMEVRGAINELSDCEQIFIDTAGRSPRDEVQVQQLRSLIKAASPDETYLVLSAPSSSKNLAEAVAKFTTVGPSSWVLTKIDEVGSLGNTLSFLQDPQLPLAYVTNGQDVPQAIAVAEAEDLVARIL